RSASRRRFERRSSDRRTGSEQRSGSRAYFRRRRPRRTEVITLIGLGAGDADTLSRGAERALREASDHHAGGRGRLFLRTARQPVVATLREWGLTFDTFDALYESAPDFSTLYCTSPGHVLTSAQ